MRFAIYGTGGVGGYFGAQLARAGHDVLFIARGEHLRAMRERGLVVETDAGEIVVSPTNATDDPAQAGGPVDAVLLCVKTWQVSESARAMQPLVGPSTMVVPLLNGVEAATQLADVLGPEPVLVGLCGTLSRVAAPGRIKSIGQQHFVRFAESDNRRSARTEALLEAFKGAGVKAEIPSDIHRALWGKFLFVTAFGGVGAAARAPAGVLRAQPETRLLLQRCMEETYAVGRARGVALPDSAVADGMRMIDALAPGATASMQRDLADGKPSELEQWSGAVVRLGREAGVPTPTHEFIYASQLPTERRARGEIDWPA